MAKRTTPPVHDRITIQGARQHNLKNLDLSFPRNRLVVITGLSGSGKSSLAFDTLYAEGQRRYVESLSAYARQFLEMMDKPDVDHIEGLSPAIAIDQKVTSRNPRSTVGTVTEIYDYLRLLYARIGHPHCPSCGRPVTPQTVSQMVDQILAFPAGERFYVLAPTVVDRKGEYRNKVGCRSQKFEKKIGDRRACEANDVVVFRLARICQQGRVVGVRSREGQKGEQKKGGAGRYEHVSAEAATG